MNFDTMLHLSCEHALPLYRAACQIQAARHIVAVAQEQAPFYNSLRQCLPEAIHLEKVNVRTSEPDAYAQRLIKVIEGLPPGRHAVHMFGASRTVFTKLWTTCQEKGLPCFFPDNETMTYRWANAGDVQVKAFEPIILKVNDFFKLSGYRLDEQRANEAWDQSLRNQAAAMAVWEERDRIKMFSRNVRDFSKSPGKPFQVNPQDVNGLTIAATLKQPKDGNQGRLQLGDQKFAVRPWAALASFLCGDWTRDILLKHLMEARAALGIVDLQTDCVLTHEHPGWDMPSRYHIDLAYTDGKSLVLLQILRRPPELHQVRNLGAVLRGLAHHSGKGILWSMEGSPLKDESIASWPNISIRSGLENGWLDMES